MIEEGTLDMNEGIFEVFNWIQLPCYHNKKRINNHIKRCVITEKSKYHYNLYYKYLGKRVKYITYKKGKYLYAKLIIFQVLFEEFYDDQY
ncbi:MAG: hypothetical protein ABIP51_20830 [Bacteroidia bacterium]